jgi:chemotaxis protein methyltransferase CheR
MNMAATTTSDREFGFTSADFRKISRLIHERAGISLSAAKTEMVYNRLSRRLRVLGLSSFVEYIDLLEQGDSAEWSEFVGTLTTHLTSFFREQHHFPILDSHMAKCSARGKKVLLWSCAASTGEEPYSMAISAAEHFDSLHPPVSILATDVDKGVLEMARAGIYPIERVSQLPSKVLKRYFLWGSGPNGGCVKVRPELQQMITYMPLNLLNPVWPIEQRFDAVFCRNVMIYFDRPIQERVLAHCLRHMKPDGLFFAGHSENLYHVAHLVEPCGNTVYRPRVSQQAGESAPSAPAECYA